MKKLNRLIIINLILYFLIVIEGETLGGFFIFYFLIGLLHVAPFALLILAGSTLLIISMITSKVKKIKLYIHIGSALLYLAFFIFIFADPDGYNMNTFRTPVSIVFMIAFVITNLYLNIAVTPYLCPHDSSGKKED